MRRIPVDGTLELLRPGQVVYWPGCAGEPLPVFEALLRNPEAARGVTFVGVWIPGVNRNDPTRLAEGARARTFFVTPELREGFVAGRVDFLPLHYSQIPVYLRRGAGIDLAIVTVSPPNRSGEVTLGVANDFTPAVLKSSVPAIALVNPRMPKTVGGPRYPLSRFDRVCQAEFPLVTLDTGEVPADIALVGARVADLVRQGDTLQFGLGKVQAAVLASLAGRRGFAIHAGMISDPVLPHLEGDALTGVLTNVALGTEPLYEACGRDPRIRFAPVARTHDFDVLRRIRNLVTVNSVIEIDLFGQANAEMMEGRQVSGHGGLVDFLRGGRSAPGGRSILATPATARNGTVSRIVPTLAPTTVGTTLRADADLVVTEFGVADLRHGSIDVRAEALIAIAAPQFRDALANQWRDLRRAM